MASERSLYCDLGGFFVADFTNEDDVGVHAQVADNKIPF
jgi:hypothetical protein